MQMNILAKTKTGHWLADGNLLIDDLRLASNEATCRGLRLLLNQIVESNNSHLSKSAFVTAECANLHAMLYTDPVDLPAMAWGIHTLALALSSEYPACPPEEVELIEQIKELDHEFDFYRNRLLLTTTKKLL